MNILIVQEYNSKMMKLNQLYDNFKRFMEPYENTLHNENYLKEMDVDTVNRYYLNNLCIYFRSLDKVNIYLLMEFFIIRKEKSFY